MKVPTDLDILSVIYKAYYEEFSNFSRGEENGRGTKIYVPIDCQEIANRLNVDADIIFGRLYYHLNRLHAYRSDDGSKVELFGFKVGSDYKCVNFPLLASVLAGLQDENRKFNFTIWVSVMAFGVSLCALGVSLYDVLK
ncbi:hypothetical protein [Pseudomonas parafulva]|uniref:hypothetical protein n=1 Tax=Pseudomonas parafulva TaxID=157782 RepID=UPI0009BF0406|nr:hypothetical protein [Pseudomonas parafulva]